MDIQPLFIPGVIAIMTLFLAVLGYATLISRDRR